MGPREWSPRGKLGVPVSCETREGRAALMEAVGIGGFCLVDGKKTEVLEFNEISGIYKFREGNHEYYVGDEAFWKGLTVMSPLQK